jgi:hypothetical protein
MAKRSSRLSRVGKFLRKERMKVVRDVEKQKLPEWVDVHHKKITVGEALKRLKTARTYIVLAVARPSRFYDEKKYYKRFEIAVRSIAPEAKIEYKPVQWMIRGKVKDPFRDAVVSNLTVSEAIELGSIMQFTTAQWKG